MTSSLDAALSGMLVHERGLDLIANNLANVSTTGYKRAVIHFQDMLDSAQVLAVLNGEVPSGGAAVTTAGVGATNVVRDFASGSLQPTGRDLDLAIAGDGFFRVRQDDGSMAYTRAGNLSLDANRRLVTASGQVLDPDMVVPLAYHDMVLGRDGSVTAMRPYTADELAALGPDALTDGVLEQIGQITLSRFSNPAGLDAIGRNLYVETERSQAPIDGAPGSDGMGEVHSGFLEAANVDLATEMTMMVLTSRAYSLNLNAYRTIEQMLSSANQLAS